MVPVVDDNADATAKTRLPNTLKLVLVSVYYGLVQAALSLPFSLWPKKQSVSSLDDSYGDTIKSDELIVPDEKKTEVEQHQEQKKRYDVYHGPF